MFGWLRRDRTPAPIREGLWHRADGTTCRVDGTPLRRRREGRVWRVWRVVCERGHWYEPCIFDWIHEWPPNLPEIPA